MGKHTYRSSKPPFHNKVVSLSGKTFEPEDLKGKYLEDGAFAGMRVSVMSEPAVPSKKTTCERCKEEVWVNEVFYDKVMKMAHRFCIECVIELEKDGDTKFR